MGRRKVASVHFAMVASFQKLIVPAFTMIIVFPNPGHAFSRGGSGSTACPHRALHPPYCMASPITHSPQDDRVDPNLEGADMGERTSGISALISGEAAGGPSQAYGSNAQVATDSQSRMNSAHVPGVDRGPVSPAEVPGSAAAASIEEPVVAAPSAVHPEVRSGVDGMPMQDSTADVLQTAPQSSEAKTVWDGKQLMAKSSETVDKPLETTTSASESTEAKKKKKPRQSTGSELTSTTASESKESKAELPQVSHVPATPFPTSNPFCISLGDIHNMPTRCILALFGKFCNFCFDVWEYGNPPPTILRLGNSKKHVLGGI